MSQNSPLMCTPVSATRLRVWLLQPVTFWARGERNIGGVLPLLVLTNCDAVELRYGELTKRAGPDRESFPHLLHAPVVIDHRHFNADELGVWGMGWEDGLFTGFVDGKPVAELRMVADPVPSRLEVAADSHTLRASGRDSTRIIVRALDQAGSRLAFLNEAAFVRVDGPGRLIGPAVLTFQGGTTGFWLETIGTPGLITVEVSSPRFASQKLQLTVWSDPRRRPTAGRGITVVAGTCGECQLARGGRIRPPASPDLGQETAAGVFLELTSQHATTKFQSLQQLALRRIGCNQRAIRRNLMPLAVVTGSLLEQTDAPICVSCIHRDGRAALFDEAARRSRSGASRICRALRRF